MNANIVKINKGKETCTGIICKCEIEDKKRGYESYLVITCRHNIKEDNTKPELRIIDIYNQPIPNDSYEATVYSDKDSNSDSNLESNSDSNTESRYRSSDPDDIAV